MSADEHQPQLEWAAVRLDDYKVPSEPATEAVWLGLQSWWQQLIQRRRPTPGREDQPPELTSAPANLLDYLLPMPDWNHLHSGMMASLWRHHDFDVSPCALFVAPPYYTLEEAVLGWAHAEDAVILPAPSISEILDSPRQWFETWPKDAAIPIVIPALERYFLRHQRGLSLIRQMIDNLSREQRRCLVVCSSWAWAFLEHACPTNLLTARPWTAGPLAAEDLRRMFARLMQQTNGTGFAFRRADNGKITLPMATEDEEHYSDEFLTHVAAHSRGNAVVAWAIWRRSLLVSTDVTEQAVEHKARTESDQDQRRKIWVQSWEKLQKPQLPLPIDDRTAFILHAILLHNGLSTLLLHRLLPVFPIELERSLRRLYTAGIIHENQGVWTVTPAAYPEVRYGLSQQGFLVDAF